MKFFTMDNFLKLSWEKTIVVLIIIFLSYLYLYFNIGDAIAGMDFFADDVMISASIFFLSATYFLICGIYTIIVKITRRKND